MYRDIQDAHWWLQGHKFGYPTCCIKSFIKLEHLQQDNEPRKLNGSGYVPCTWCNENRTEQQMVNTINFNRDPELEPFKPCV